MTGSSSVALALAASVALVGVANAQCRDENCPPNQACLPPIVPGTIGMCYPTRCEDMPIPCAEGRECKVFPDHSPFPLCVLPGTDEPPPLDYKCKPENCEEGHACTTTTEDFGFCFATSCEYLECQNDTVCRENSWGPNNDMPRCFPPGDLPPDFPIKEMAVDEYTLSKLNSTDLRAREVAATDALVPLLRNIFSNETFEGVKVEPADSGLTVRIPDETIDGSCSTNIKALNNRVTAELMSSSYLRFGGDVDWGEGTASVFADAALDARVRLQTDVRVSTGARVFGSCVRIARKTVGVDVTSSGNNAIGLSLTASNARVELGQDLALELVFDLDVDVLSLMLDWDVDNVDVSNCDIKILGIRILSVCGLMRRTITSGLEEFNGQVLEVVSPSLAEKVQNALRTTLGDEVRIKLITPFVASS